MLVSLKIENFALIEQLALSLQPGLNVLTGETGAGKSIILDAIDAVLGGKATGRWVRTGTSRAFLEAAFQLSPRISAWFEAQAIPCEGEVFTCQRELTAGKTSVRSRSRLNGVSVKKPQLEELRHLLIEITAQGQTLQLGSPDLQRDWLDGFGQKSLAKQRDRVAADYEAATAAKKILDARRQADRQRAEQLEMFEFQSKELTAADLDDPDELEDLQLEHQRLSHSVELQQQSYQVYQMLYENDGGQACADMLGQAENILTDMLRFDPEVSPILDMIGEAMAQVQEAGRQMNTYGEGIETDPARLADIDRRMVQLKQLCRKYNRDLPDLIDYYQSIQASLAALHGDGQSIEALETDYQHKQAALIESCAKLTKLRQKAAKTLEQDLVTQLEPLAMERVKFKVDIQSQLPAVHGADRVAFLFSPNPGEPLQPLVEIASGGEMSRFLLALKACFSRVDPIGTMVFDEIDVGVSGRVAQAIAEKLHHLSREHQVLCVTHQPLVAAMADAHFHVGKHVVTLPPQSASALATDATDATDPADISDKSAKDSRAREAKSTAAKNGRKRQRSASSPAEEEKARAKIAAQTGKKLNPKAASRQVRAATNDGVGEERTVVKVTALDAQSRRDELAQLAGGRSHSEAIAFADSLLVQAETIRKAG